MSHGDLQGWFGDPFRLHEQRYFSAGKATKLVRDGTTESYDEAPPSDLADALAGSGDFTAGSWQLGDESAANGPVQPRRLRRGRGFGVVYTVALVTAAAVAAVVIIAIRHSSGDSSRLASASEVAFVTQSAHRTLAERTADVTISGAGQAAGQTLKITGTGEIDFSTGAAAMTMQVSASGQQIAEKEIMTHGHVYYALTVDGLNPVRMASDRDWIDASVPTMRSAASLTSDDPRAALVLLEQHGDAVRVLGTRSVAGVICTGYAVTPSRQAMTAAMQKEISALKLPSSAADLLRSIAPPTVTVWLDAHGVLHRISLELQMGGLSGAAASANVTEDLSNYGAPVHVTAPAARDVISYQTFRQMAANANAS